MPTLQFFEYLPAPLNESIDYLSLKQKNVLAYAMEGSAIYQTSWLFNVPSLVVRARA